MANPLKKIFPNVDKKLFEHYLKTTKDIDMALYSYGEIRKGKYPKERQEIKKYYLKKGWKL